MPHIFISYAKKDTRKLAIRLSDRLNALDSVTAWVDRSLRAGKAWETQIEQEILRCDTMIVLLSPDVNRHLNGKPESYVLTEISYAKYTAKKPIIPVMAQTTTAPISLTREHYIDFTIEGLTLDDLVDALVLELDIEIDDTPDESPAPIDVLPAPEPTIETAPTIEAAIAKARNFKGTKNSNWTPIIETFEVKGLKLDMCLVPVGRFMMGDGNKAHEQTITEPYWIGVHPITNAQWRHAVENSNGAIQVPEWADWYNDSSKSNHPVVGVTWFQCRDFAKWLGDDWRLPSELQWEYAARGVESWVYPFGDDFQPDLVVYSANSNHSTAAIRGRPQSASWIGAQDMSGNVWEWQSTIYQDYPYRADDGREVDANKTDVRRVLRGGSWFNNYATFLRAANRLHGNPVGSFDSFGFRCARSCG